MKVIQSSREDKGGIIRKTLIAVVAIAIIGCNPYYRPYNGEIGYGSLLLEDDNIEVTFTAAADYNKTMIKKFCLFQAAEIADKKGMPYLVILNEEYDYTSTVRKVENHREIMKNEDSCKTIKIQIKESPDYIITNDKMNLKLICHMTHEDSSNCISVEEILAELTEYKIMNMNYGVKNK